MIWREIPGYEGRYRISEFGVVQSSHQNGPLSKRTDWWDMSRPLAKSGHELVYLWDSATKKRVRRLVHQLVAELFLPRVSGKNCVNHIDGNKINNHFSNLEWCTLQENMKHAWRTGLCKPPKLTPEQVREIRSCGGLDTATASRFGVSQVMVTKIRARKAWRSVE